MAAAGAALRLRLLYRMVRVGELLALVAFLSWSSSRVPSAAAAALRLAGSLLLNARFVFVLGNAIVLLLLALSRRDLSASSSTSSSSPSGQHQTSAAATGTTAAAPPPEDAAPDAASASASFIPSSFTGTPIPPPPAPATSLEAAYSAPPPAAAASAMEAAASPAPAHAGTAAFDDRSEKMTAPRVSSKLARAPRRSRSEKMAGPRVLQVRRAASPPAELRRSESENGRRRSSVSARDAARARGWGADDADEFRRTVEAFIEQHKRFHRQESMTTMAVVAAGSGHCEANPAFTGALAVVE